MAQARLDLEHTEVRAPANGVVANLTLRPGNIVRPGVPLFSIVGTDGTGSTPTSRRRSSRASAPGQQAKIVVDMYPKHPFAGEVESVSPGSGTAFSLLPPQNATGNWVKVTQRVPVRVRVIDPDPQLPLRIGTTAKVRRSHSD